MNLLIIQFCNKYSLNLWSALRRRPDIYRPDIYRPDIYRPDIYRPDIYRPPDIQTLNFFRVFRYDYQKAGVFPLKILKRLMVT